MQVLRWLMISVSAAVTVSDLSAETTNATTLRVGMATAEITPPLGYPMSGYYYERGATGALDPLQAKAIVFDDGQTRLAIVVCDLIGISTDLCSQVRERVSQSTNISAHNVMVTATHCHTAPDYYADFRKFLAGQQTTETTNYPSRLVTGIVSAIESAMDSCSEATLSVGSGNEESVSFNRRFVTTDGSIRTWANYRDPKVVRAAGPIDPALDMLLVKEPAANTSNDGATPTYRGALTAFALHLDTTGGSKFSADFPFHMERALRSNLGEEFLSIFAAGTCGDINHVNPQSKDRNRPHVIGARLSDAFVAAMPSMKDVVPALRMKRRIVQIPLKSFTKDELTQAHEIIAKDKAGEEVPFLDEVNAYNIRLLSVLREGPQAHRNRSTNDGGQGWGTSTSLVGIGASMPVEVQVMQLGTDAVVVGLPGEVFVELGLSIKRASPYRHTMVFELANSDESGYIPTKLAYQGGGYEVINSVFQPGGGEMLVEATIELLREMKSE